MSSATGTQAVDRAARLLGEVLEAPSTLSFSELAAATGLAKSTASRLLVALERNELVARDASGRFSPGEAFLRFGWRRGGQGDLAAIAGPYLERLAERCGETVNLGVARGGAVEQVAQVDSRFLLGATSWLGRPVPLHCTAQGKVLLAFGAAVTPAGRLERCTTRTITSRRVLEAELEAVRRRGFAMTDGELELGLVAVAAPVRNDAGTALAAVSVSGPESRLGAARLRDVAALCVEQSSALSRALGHRGAVPAGRAEKDGAA